MRAVFGDCKPKYQDQDKQDYGAEKGNFRMPEFLNRAYLMTPPSLIAVVRSGSSAAEQQSSTIFFSDRPRGLYDAFLPDPQRAARRLLESNNNESDQNDLRLLRFSYRSSGPHQASQGNGQDDGGEVYGTGLRWRQHRPDGRYRP